MRSVRPEHSGSGTCMEQGLIERAEAFGRFELTSLCSHSKHNRRWRCSKCIPKEAEAVVADCRCRPVHSDRRASPRSDRLTVLFPT